MKEIKFRAWNGGMMRYLHLDEFTITQDGVYAPNEMGEKWIQRDWPLMQFTGLHDKNGKDIYEGDIVLAHDSWGKYSGAIEWWNDRWVLRFPGSDGTPQNQSLMTVRGPKVIGNIFESPELWEG